MYYSANLRCRTTACKSKSVLTKVVPPASEDLFSDSEFDINSVGGKDRRSSAAGFWPASVFLPILCLY